MPGLTRTNYINRIKDMSALGIATGGEIVLKKLLSNGFLRRDRIRQVLNLLAGHYDITRHGATGKREIDTRVRSETLRLPVGKTRHMQRAGGALPYLAFCGTQVMP
ncbi:hypothetical protein ES703_107390 [subsurface metagenome]